MCLISREIESVSDTKILVSPNYNNTRQLTVYSNYVNNLSESNAMVLPVPLPQTIQFIDLSGYKKIFDDCDKCFYNPTRGRGIMKCTNSYSRENTPLQVFNVGSYQVSVAMNLEQIEQVDSRVFELSPGLKKTLKTFYYQDYWGFVICKLNSGPESYHPIAYSHQIIDKKIYIPTRHYHQEAKWTDVNNLTLGSYIDPRQNQVNTQNWNEYNINQSPMFRMDDFGLASPEANRYDNIVPGIDSNSIYSSNKFEMPKSKFDSDKYQSKQNSLYSQFKTYFTDQILSKNIDLKKSSDSTYKNIADDWSHSIYLINLNSKTNKQLDKMNSCNEVWNHGKIHLSKFNNFDFGELYNFEKIKIIDTHPNIDLVIPIST